MTLTRETVKDYVENSNLVQKKEFDKYPGLYLLKYKRKVFYENLWDEFLENMRGTVVSEDYYPIAMPFQKIYNRGENNMDFGHDEEVTAVRKINGFMLALTYVPEVDRVLPSTTGSLDSEFINKGLEYVTPEMVAGIRNLFYSTGIPTTFLFEVCHPDDPHIVPEEEGIYLLEMREVDWGGLELKMQDKLDEVAEALQVKRPEWHKTTFGEILEDVKKVKHEGFVVHNQHFKSLKLKSPYYLTTKFIGRMKDEKFEKWLAHGILKSKVDEEFYPLCDYLKEVEGEFLNHDEQGRIEFIRRFLDESIYR